MLVLSRKIGEAIRIGPDVHVRIVSLNGGQVRLAIDAPEAIGVHREEVYQRIAAANREAMGEDPDTLRAWSLHGMSKNGEGA